MSGLLAVLLMDHAVKKAFDAAQDAIKQFLTLSTAVIGGVVTFSGSGTRAILDFKAAGPAVPISMILLLVSIAAGLFALMNVIGTLSKDQKPDLYKPSIRWFAGAQIVLFFVAICVLVSAPSWDWGGVGRVAKTEARTPVEVGAPVLERTEPPREGAGPGRVTYRLALDVKEGASRTGPGVLELTLVREAAILPAELRAALPGLGATEAMLGKAHVAELDEVHAAAQEDFRRQLAEANARLVAELAQAETRLDGADVASALHDQTCALVLQANAIHSNTTLAAPAAFAACHSGQGADAIAASREVDAAIAASTPGLARQSYDMAKTLPATDMAIHDLARRLSERRTGRWAARVRQYQKRLASFDKVPDGALVSLAEFEARCKKDTQDTGGVSLLADWLDDLARDVLRSATAITAACRPAMGATPKVGTLAAIVLALTPLVNEHNCPGGASSAASGEAAGMALPGCGGRVAAADLQVSPSCIAALWLHGKPSGAGPSLPSSDFDEYVKRGRDGTCTLSAIARSGDRDAAETASVQAVEADDTRSVLVQAGFNAIVRAALSKHPAPLPAVVDGLGEQIVAVELIGDHTRIRFAGPLDAAERQAGVAVALDARPTRSRLASDPALGRTWINVDDLTFLTDAQMGPAPSRPVAVVIRDGSRWTTRALVVGVASYGEPAQSKVPGYLKLASAVTLPVAAWRTATIEVEPAAAADRQLWMRLDRMASEGLRAAPCVPPPEPPTDSGSVVGRCAGPLQSVSAPTDSWHTMSWRWDLAPSACSGDPASCVSNGPTRVRANVSAPVWWRGVLAVTCWHPDPTDVRSKASASERRSDCQAGMVGLPGGRPDLSSLAYGRTALPPG
jgi:hypothetical protein